MALLVTEYLEQSAERFPDKKAFIDDKREMTYKELRDEAHLIATALISENIFKKPIAVFLDKSVECIAAFLGVACSGNFYTPLDTGMPKARIEKILNTLEPSVVITDAAHKKEVLGFAGHCQIIVYEQVLEAEAVSASIKKTTERILDTDVLYVLFTSGSTGTPKGVVVSHKALVDFTEWGSAHFGIDDSYVFGNQTPFYFSMSVIDIYQTLKNGCSMYIISRDKFSFPVLLMDYLHKNKINTIVWVPSALTMVATFRALSSPHLPELKNVFFGGEVMPMKQLNKWITEYPDARYVNLYGPTEVTDTCTIYEVNRPFENTERLPIGSACANMDVFLLDEKNHLVLDHKRGEVCVRGTGLAYGYYHDEKKTNEVFVQNPLNPFYPERIYRTGDLAERNEFGELVYVGRKDFQIKHMGHRIELGEIEAAISAMEGVDANACIYEQEKSRILLFYTGKLEEQLLMTQLKNVLPEYMFPNKRVHLEQMPMNLNGKIDREKLKLMK